SKTRMANAKGPQDTAFARQLRGDLDCIVLKMLSYSASDRYQSWSELKADLQCYLDGDVVAARRASFVERAGKFFRRRKRELVQVAAVSAAMGIAVAASEVHAHFQRKSAREKQIASMSSDLRRMIAVSSQPVYSWHELFG